MALSAVLTNIRALVVDDDKTSRNAEVSYLRSILGIAATDTVVIRPKEDLRDAVDTFAGRINETRTNGASAFWDIVLLDMRFDTKQLAASKGLMRGDAPHGGLYAYFMMNRIIAQLRPFCPPLFLFYTASTNNQAAYAPFRVTDGDVGLRPFQMVIKASTMENAEDLANLRSGLLAAEADRFHALSWRGLANLPALWAALDEIVAGQIGELTETVMELQVLPGLPIWKVFPVRCSLLQRATGGSQKIASAFQKLIGARHYPGVLHGHLNIRQNHADGEKWHFDGSREFGEWYYIAHPQPGFLEEGNVGLWPKYFEAWISWLKRSVTPGLAQRVGIDLRMLREAFPASETEELATLCQWKKRSREPNAITQFVSVKVNDQLDGGIVVTYQSCDRLQDHQCYIDSGLLAELLAHYLTNNAQHMGTSPTVIIRPELISDIPKFCWSIDVGDTGPGFNRDREGVADAVLWPGKTFQQLKERLAGWCEIELWTQHSGNDIVGVSVATGGFLPIAQKPDLMNQTDTRVRTVLRFVFSGGGWV